MVYLFGIFGFFGGFMLGLFLINLFLRDVARDRLTADKSLRWTYGVAVWLLAGLGAYAAVWIHGRHYVAG